MKFTCRGDNQMIVNALKTHGPMTAEEICFAIYNEIRSIRGNLRILRENGIIVKSKMKRRGNAIWELK